MSLRCVTAAVAAALMLTQGTVRAQTCVPQWINGGIPALDGTAYCTVMWDPDGAGPRQSALVVGGSFALAGATNVSNLALWDGVAWSDIGGGVSGTNHGATAINGMAVMANGDLVVGGVFDSAGAGGGAITANCIARFNGTAWSPMSNGTWRNVDTVRTMTSRNNGDLVVVGGLFRNADNTLVGPLVNWNDVNGDGKWKSFASTLPPILDLLTVAAMSNGDLIIGGHQGTMPGMSAAWRWNEAGGVWEGFGTGVGGTEPLSQVFSILELAGGDVVLAGNFTSASGLAVNSIARWHNGQFFAYGTGITYPSQPFQLAVRALAQMPNGDVVAGGQFDTAGGNVGGRVARWDGLNWTRLPQGAGDVVWSLMRTPRDELIVAGAYTFAGGSFANKRVARYTDEPSPWVADGPGEQAVDEGQTVVLSATPATTFVNVSVQWKRDGVAIANGAGGASAGGGTVSGASAAMESPTAGNAAVLTITGARASDSGAYTAVFSNACGDATSAAADVTIGAACAADLNGDHEVDLADYFEFFNCFDTSQECADLDGVEGVDLGDFFAFFNAFDVGC